MKTKALAVSLTLALATTILGQEPTPPQERPEAIRKLSKRERRERLSKLEERHRDFVRDVEPILLPAELDLFLSLEKDTDRDTFVDEFWRRRDHLNHTSGQFKDAYYKRLAAAKELFKNASSDRAKMFLLHGPPAEVVRTSCNRVVQPTEIWKYPRVAGLGNDIRLIFYKPRHQSDYRLWNPIGGATALAELVATPDILDPSAAGHSDPAAGRRPQAREEPFSSSPYAYITRIQLECAEGNELMLAVTQMIQARVDLLKIFRPPELSQEDTQKMLRSLVIANPNAPKLTAEFSVRYPAKDGSRTDAQMMLLVPREQLSPAVAGESEVYTIDVAGEILKEGELWEKYRYRFDFPGDIEAEKLPVVIDRLLRPSEYIARIKVTDANTGAEALVEAPLNVPEIFAPVLDATAPAMASAPEAETPAAEDAAHAVEPRLRIVPPARDPVSGLQTIEPIVSGDAIKAVEWWLDGKKLAVRRTAPFTIDLDFGEIPTMHRVRAVALAKDDQPLTGDEIAINIGTDPFRVRIVSPRVAPHLSGTARVELEVNVPEHEELDRLELFWNERRLATLFDPPFVQTIDVPATEGVGYIRAVATLKNDSIPPVEDVVLINSPAYMEEMNVHLVEIPTTVLIDGKPSDKLTEKNFKILDEGKPVTLAKFEYVRNLPLSVGMAIDSSGSMQNRIDEAQKAGAQFFEKVLRKGDKAFLVAFDTEARLMQKWSNRISDVQAGLAKVRAEDKTALYDAIVYALYNFHGVRGQKALVVISDGRDTASHFTYDQALEYARRSGIPIYGIGIGIRSNDTEVRFKLDKLSRETGGTTYYIDQARDLQRVYDDIQSELRSQYILGFYPSGDIKPGSKWRELTVQASEGKVKAIKGYFP